MSLALPPAFAPAPYAVVGRFAPPVPFHHVHGGSAPGLAAPQLGQKLPWEQATKCGQVSLLPPWQAPAAMPPSSLPWHGSVPGQQADRSPSAPPWQPTPAGGSLPGAGFSPKADRRAFSVAPGGQPACFPSGLAAEDPRDRKRRQQQEMQAALAAQIEERGARKREDQRLQREQDEREAARIRMETEAEGVAPGSRPSRRPVGAAAMDLPSSSPSAGAGHGAVRSPSFGHLPVAGSPGALPDQSEEGERERKRRQQEEFQRALAAQVEEQRQRKKDEERKAAEREAREEERLRRESLEELQSREPPEKQEMPEEPQKSEKRREMRQTRERMRETKADLMRTGERSHDSGGGLRKMRETGTESGMRRTRGRESRASRRRPRTTDPGSPARARPQVGQSPTPYGASGQMISPAFASAASTWWRSASPAEAGAGAGFNSRAEGLGLHGLVEWQAELASDLQRQVDDLRRQRDEAREEVLRAREEAINSRVSELQEMQQSLMEQLQRGTAPSTTGAEVADGYRDTSASGFGVAAVDLPAGTAFAARDEPSGTVGGPGDVDFAWPLLPPQAACLEEDEGEEDRAPATGIPDALEESMVSDSRFVGLEVQPFHSQGLSLQAQLSSAAGSLDEQTAVGANEIEASLCQSASLAANSKMVTAGGNTFKLTAANMPNLAASVSLAADSRMVGGDGTSSGTATLEQALGHMHTEQASSSSQRPNTVFEAEEDNFPVHSSIPEGPSETVDPLCSGELQGQRVQDSEHAETVSKSPELSSTATNSGPNSSTETSNGGSSPEGLVSASLAADLALGASVASSSSGSGVFTRAGDEVEPPLPRSSASSSAGSSTSSAAASPLVGSNLVVAAIDQQLEAAGTSVSCAAAAGCPLGLPSQAEEVDVEELPEASPRPEMVATATSLVAEVVMEELPLESESLGGAVNDEVLLREHLDEMRAAEFKQALKRASGLDPNLREDLVALLEAPNSSTASSTSRGKPPSAPSFPSVRGGGHIRKIPAKHRGVAGVKPASAGPSATRNGAALVSLYPKPSTAPSAQPAEAPLRSRRPPGETRGRSSLAAAGLAIAGR